jgi:hypothetical protein
LSFSAAAKQVAEKLLVLSAAAEVVPFQIKIRNKIKIKIKGSGQECPLYTNCLFWHQLCYRQLIGLAQFGKQPCPGGDHEQSSYSSEDYGWDSAEPLRG